MDCLCLAFSVYTRYAESCEQLPNTALKLCEATQSSTGAASSLVQSKEMRATCESELQNEAAHSTLLTRSSPLGLWLVLHGLHQSLRKPPQAICLFSAIGSSVQKQVSTNRAKGRIREANLFVFEPDKATLLRLQPRLHPQAVVLLLGPAARDQHPDASALSFLDKQFENMKKIESQTNNKQQRFVKANQNPGGPMLAADG